MCLCQSLAGIMLTKVAALRIAVQEKLEARSTLDLPTLWWENEEGARFYPDLKNPYANEAPKGYVFQVSRFPKVLRTTWLRSVVPEEVAACPHDVEFVQPTYGWIDGVEGRECKKCHGIQTRKVGEPWPGIWDATGAREYMSSESSWSVDLVLAMTRPTHEELKKAIDRYGSPGRMISLDDAIIVGASTCERCLNALLYRYGCEDGYPRNSKEWDECPTECEFCVPPTLLDWLMNQDPATKVASRYLAAVYSSI